MNSTRKLPENLDLHLKISTYSVLYTFNAPFVCVMWIRCLNFVDIHE